MTTVHFPPTALEEALARLIAMGIRHRKLDADLVSVKTSTRWIVAKFLVGGLRVVIRTARPDGVFDMGAMAEEIVDAAERTEDAPGLKA